MANCDHDWSYYSMWDTKLQGNRNGLNKGVIPTILYRNCLNCPVTEEVTRYGIHVYESVEVKRPRT